MIQELIDLQVTDFTRQKNTIYCCILLVILRINCVADLQALTAVNIVCRYGFVDANAIASYKSTDGHSM